MNYSFSTFNPNYNIMGHPNVLMSAGLSTTTKNDCQTNTALYAALNPLLTARPNWRFLAKEAARTSGAEVITHFSISEDGEVLGEIGLEYKGSGYKIVVTNERIQNERQRRRSYYTLKPEKATLAIRKNFFRLAVTERIEKARVEAYNVVTTEANGKESKFNSATNAMFSEARRFCEQHLTEYIDFANKHSAQQGIQRAQEERDCTKNIKQSFDNDKTYLVVLDLSQYLVHSNEGVSSFDDETLPDSIRGKLGLLKLVQPKQMISNVGCRVSDTVFVVMKEEAK